MRRLGRVVLVGMMAVPGSCGSASTAQAISSRIILVGLLCAIGLAGGKQARAGGGESSGPASQIGSAATGRDSALVTAFSDSLARAHDLLKQGKFADAEGVARALLSEADAAPGKDSLRVADVLDELIDALVREGKASQPASRVLAEQAVRIRERAAQQPQLAKSLSNLGFLLRALDDNAGARPLYERALAIREKTLGPTHFNVAGTLNDLGSVSRAVGDYAAARQYYERARAILEKALGPDDPNVAGVLGNLATISQDIGDYAAARPLYERALQIREKTLGPDHPDVGLSLNNLGTLLEFTGDYVSARPLFEHAHAIWEKAFGPDNPYVAMSLENIGALLDDIGDRATARSYYERGLSIMEKSEGPDHPDVGEVVNNLADLRVESGDFAAARPLYERALRIFEKTLGPDHPQVATVLNHLANVHHASGDDAGARAFYDRASAIYEKAFGPDHPDLANNLNDLANMLRETGDETGAQSLLERVLAIREKAFGPDHPSVAVTDADIAKVDEALGRPAACLDAALEAERIGRQHLRLTARTLSERQALQYAATRPTGLDLALSSLDRQPDASSGRKALDAVIRSRALVLDEMGARHHSVGDSNDSALTRLRARVVSTSTRYANLVVRGPGDAHPESYTKLLDQARREKDDAERAMAEESLPFRREQAKQAIGLADVESALPPGSALVSFERYARRESLLVGRESKPVPSYLGFVVLAGNHEPAVVHLGAAAEIDSLIGAWRATCGSAPLRQDGVRARSEAFDRRAGEALRRRVWDAIADRIPGVGRVFVVPDGALNLLNFGTLPDGQSDYLIESGPVIQYLSSERDLVLAGPAPPPVGEGLLAVGGADFEHAARLDAAANARAWSRSRAARDSASSEPYRGGHSSCGDFTTIRFPPLPASAEEANEVASLWSADGRRRGGNSDVEELTGPTATEAMFKQSAPGRRVLHLATHGFFLDDQCSSLDRTRGIGFTGASKSAPRPVDGDNPLLLSGLALAGANERAQVRAGEDDGILTSEEIAALDLSGVEWAVLSACETGVG